MNKLPKSEKVKRIKELFSDLSGDDVEGLRKIITEMQVFGLDVKRIIADNYITAGKYAKLNEEQLDLINNPPEIVKKRTFDDEYNSLSHDQKIELIENTMQNVFIRGSLTHDKDSQGLDIFSVIDYDKKVCVKLSNDVSKQKGVFINRLGCYLRDNDTLTHPNIVGEMYSYWNTFVKPVTNISYSRTAYDPSDWTLYYSSYIADKEIPFPHIKATLDRMSEGPAFAAWIWGVYTGLYRGRQIFWTYGEEGEEGKSYFILFLGRELFGENFGFKSISNEQIVGKSPFIMGSFIGARLIAYPDCNNRHALKTEKMKVLSGGGRDMVYADRKYKDAQSIIIDARMLIASNFLPSVLKNNWYLSRLALNKITPFKGPKNPHISDLYLPELPGFLAYAKECYEKLCPTHEAIQLSEGNKVLIKELQDAEDPVDSDLFDKYFELNGASAVKLRDVTNLLSLEGLNKEAQKGFLKYLETLGVTSGKTMGRQTLKGMLIKGKDSLESKESDPEMEEILRGIE